MKVRIHAEIGEICGLWKRLYRGNRELTWFQSYEWNAALERQFAARRITRYGGCALQYVVIDDEFIAPLVIDRLRRRVELLGSREASDYLSFEFTGEMADARLRACTEALLDRFPGYTFAADRIHESSRLVRIFQQIGRQGRYAVRSETRACVRIDVRAGTESFCSSLSRSTRQNYRTAVNRIHRDGHTYEVLAGFGRLSEDEGRQLLELHRSRRAACDSRRTAKERILARLREAVKRLLGEEDVDVLSEYARAKEVFLSIIRIDGCIAAFCEGDLNNDGRTLSIARVAIGEAYCRYSPGQILLLETIEKLRDRLDCFDLTRGTEDYKRRLGGVVHYNHFFELRGKP